MKRVECERDQALIHSVKRGAMSSIRVFAGSHQGIISARRPAVRNRCIAVTFEVAERTPWRRSTPHGLEGPGWNRQYFPAAVATACKPARLATGIPIKS